MLERNGDVLTTAIPDNRKHNLLPKVAEHVAPGTICRTDELRSYTGLTAWASSMMSEPCRWRYVTATGWHVQGIKNFWSQLKRAINGTHIHVSGKHLWKYAKEAEYRFNRCDRAEMMLSELLTTFRPLS